MRPRSTVSAALLAAALAAPASAGAVTLTVTGDAGQPVALTEGAQLTTRHMAPTITPTFSPSEKQYSLEILAPGGKTDVQGAKCVSTAGTEQTRLVTYEGNGEYTVKFTTYASAEDFYCEQNGTTQTFSFTINASMTLTPPATTLLYRSSRPGFKDAVFTYGLNPGAASYRIVYAFDAKLGPNGEIAGEYDKENFRELGVGIPNGSIAIRFEHAGLVTIEAQAFAGNGGSPFSPPLALTIVSPFDFASTPSWKDSKGPSYSIGGQVSEPLAAGEALTMSMAKGKGKFKRVATSKIAADRGFLFKFKQKKPGSYRVRYEFKGSKFMTAGVWSHKLTIKKRSVGLDKLTHVSGD